MIEIPNPNKIRKMPPISSPSDETLTAFINIRNKDVGSIKSRTSQLNIPVQYERIRLPLR